LSSPSWDGSFGDRAVLKAHLKPTTAWGWPVPCYQNCSRETPVWEDFLLTHQSERNTLELLFSISRGLIYQLCKITNDCDLSNCWSQHIRMFSLINQSHTIFVRSWTSITTPPGKLHSPFLVTKIPSYAVWFGNVGTGPW
jgi:hypothetical protein